MKFDATRAARHLETMEKLACQTEKDHEGLADWLATELERSGWAVERQVVIGSASAGDVRRVLGRLGLALGMTCLMVLAMHDAGIGWRLACWIVAVLIWAFAPATFRLRRASSIPPMKRAALVIARRASAQEPARRVLVQASLGPSKRSPNHGGEKWINRALVFFAVLLLFAALESTAAIPQGLRLLFAGLGWLCIVVLWVTPLLGLLINLMRDRPEAWCCDRPGLALLLELARVWPSARTQNVELALAAVGGQDFDQAGDRALAVMLGNEWAAKPTLHVIVDAPGVGKELLIQSHGRFVLDAAESLWVPHRLPSKREVEERVLYFPYAEPERVVWLGGSENGQDVSAANPEVLCRVASLIAELALRWGKLDDHRRRQPDDRNTSRSLQKPG
jgi:hypothetical protein